MGSDQGLLQTLHDIEAIKRLKARYFRALDTKAWDEFADVFTEDIRVDVDGFTFEGRDSFVDQLKEILATTSTVHHGHMPEITVVDADHATGIWAMMDYLVFAGEPPQKGFYGYGHYHETYVKHAGQWRISKTELLRLRVDPF
jgi:uncharacterized protein (TIGR02246 family)